MSQPLFNRFIQNAITISLVICEKTEKSVCPFPLQKTIVFQKWRVFVFKRFAHIRNQMRISNLIPTKGRAPRPRRLHTIKERTAVSYSDDEDSSDEEAEARKKGVTVKSKIKGKGFKFALKQISKNSAWVKPPDPPVTFDYNDPSDTPPDGYLPSSRSHASSAMIYVKKGDYGKPASDSKESVMSVSEPRIYVFGGETVDGKRSRRFDYFDCNTKRWKRAGKKPSGGGRWPKARIKSAMTCIDNNLVVAFGGSSHGRPEFFEVQNCSLQETLRHRRALKTYTDLHRLLETTLLQKRQTVIEKKVAYLSDLHIYNVREDKILDLYNDLPVHNQITNYCTLPAKRAGHSLEYMKTFTLDPKFEQKLLDLGGSPISRDESPDTNDEQTADQTELNLLQIPPKNIIPDPYEEDLKEHFTSTGSVLLFGGTRDSGRRNKRNQLIRGDPNVCYNDLYRLDMYTLKWYEIEPAGRKPPPMAFHSSVVVGNSMFIHGGVGESGCVWGSMFELKYTPLDWMVYDYDQDAGFGQKISPEEKARRSEERARMVKEASTSLYGEIGSFSWHCINLTPVESPSFSVLCPPQLYCGALFKNPSDMSHEIIVYGGITNESSNYSPNGMPVFDTKTRKWCKAKQVRTPPPNGPQSGQVVVADPANSKVWIWGGVGVTDQGMSSGKFPSQNTEEADKQSRELLKHEEKIIAVLGTAAHCLPPVRVPITGLAKSKLGLWGKERVSLLGELERLQKIKPSVRWTKTKEALGRSDRIKKKVNGLTFTMSGVIRRPWTVDSPAKVSKNSMNGSGAAAKFRRHARTASRDSRSRNRTLRHKKSGKKMSKSMPSLVISSPSNQASFKVVDIASPKTFFE
jgi:hypothetical protein